MSLTDSISQAIATMEGFYTAGSIAQRNNNPGNLRSWGSNPVVDGYAKFPTVADGWAALNQQVNLNISRGLSLYEFFGGKPGVYAGYSPSADANNPQAYAVFVAGRVGIDPSVPLNSIGSSGVSDAGDGTDTASIFDTLNPFGSEDRSVDWGLVAGLGLAALAIWWMAAD